MYVDPPLPSSQSWRFLQENTKGGISPDVTAILTSKSAQLPTQAIIRLALSTATTPNASHRKISLVFQTFLASSVEKLDQRSFSIKKPWEIDESQPQSVSAMVHLDFLLSSLLILSQLRKNESVQDIVEDIDRFLCALPSYPAPSEQSQPVIDELRRALEKIKINFLSYKFSLAEREIKDLIKYLQ